MKDLFKALNKFRKEVGVEKTGVNPFYDSNYYLLEDVIAAANTLSEYGLCWYQHHEGDKLVTSLYHMESGEGIQSSVSIGEFQDSQKWGAANTYKRRIALITLLGLSQPDDDGNLTLAEKPKNLKKELDPRDFDYSGQPYRVFHAEDKIGAAFSDIKAWGGALRKTLENQKYRKANIPEIERILNEVDGDAEMHHKTKSSMLKSLTEVLSIAQGVDHV
jgi:hypothetical protein